MSTFDDLKAPDVLQPLVNWLTTHTVGGSISDAMSMYNAVDTAVRRLIHQLEDERRARDEAEMILNDLYRHETSGYQAGFNDALNHCLIELSAMSARCEAAGDIARLTGLPGVPDRLVEPGTAAYKYREMAKFLASAAATIKARCAEPPPPGATLGRLRQVIDLVTPAAAEIGGRLAQDKRVVRHPTHVVVSLPVADAAKLLQAVSGREALKRDYEDIS